MIRYNISLTASLLLIFILTELFMSLIFHIVC